jgi:hypothetical protein
LTLERAIEYIDIDEYVETTPKSLRLRKRILDATARKRAIVGSCLDQLTGHDFSVFLGPNGAARFARFPFSKTIFDF